MRYHICKNDQLLALGIVPGSQKDQTDGRTSSGEAASLELRDSLDQDQLSTDNADSNAGAEDLRPDRRSPGEGTWVAERLSVPPSKRLESTTSIHEPCSPIKKPSDPKDSLESVVLDRSTSLRDLAPAFSRIVVRTPSPGFADDRIVACASPEEVQNARPNALQVLKGVFGSALRRRGGRERLSPNSAMSGPERRSLDQAAPSRGASASSPLSATSSIGSLHSASGEVSADGTAN